MRLLKKKEKDWFISRLKVCIWCLLTTTISQIWESKNDGANDGESHHDTAARHDVLERVVTTGVPHQVAYAKDRMPHDREGEDELHGEQAIWVHVLLEPVEDFVEVAREVEWTRAEAQHRLKKKHDLFDLF